MQNYNNYGGYNNPGGRVNPYGINNYGYGVNTQPGQQRNGNHIYVNGRAGAEAYPIPPGIDVVELWDADEDRLYIKGYDNTGRPRILYDKDLIDHVEPEPVKDVDMSAYAMITEALQGISMPNMSAYVTEKDMNKALSELAVGTGGKVVRTNEHDA